MSFRAKCKLCSTLIQAKEPGDYVSCACYEISIKYEPGQTQFIARDWDNFIRIDEEGNEVLVKPIEKDDISSPKPHPEGISKPSKEELLAMLNTMIKNIEELPPHAMTTPVNHYDLLSALLLVAALFRASCKADN